MLCKVIGEKFLSLFSQNLGFILLLEGKVACVMLQVTRINGYIHIYMPLLFSEIANGMVVAFSSFSFFIQHMPTEMSFSSLPLGENGI